LNRIQKLDLLKKDLRSFQPGPKNSITDIKGVRVGHFTINKDTQGYAGEKISIRTGLTAIIPCDMKEENRLFAGMHVFRSNTEITGYQVTDDFCYLNSPVILSNSRNIGRVYNAILSFGFSLGRSEIWPPVVLGLDDSWLNDLDKFSINENQIIRLLQNCSSEPVEEGSVGVGFGLRAFGWKGGIGTSSRVFSFGGKKFHVGVLVASNHGNPFSFNQKKQGTDKDSAPTPGSLNIVMSVDIPLVPYQIKTVANNVAVGLLSIHTMTNNQDSLTCFLFSTANAMSMKNEGPLVFNYSAAGDSVLDMATRAGVEAVKEALFNSLLKARPVEGRLGRRMGTIPEAEIRKLFKGSSTRI
jgi:D-aminopeptidase